MADFLVLVEEGYLLHKGKHRLIEYVSSAMRTPFVDRGRELGKGFDCWGLVHSISNEVFGNNIPDFTIGSEDKNRIYMQFLERTREEFYEIDKDQIREGDIAALNMIISSPNVVQHFGIFINKNTFIHTLKKAGPQLTKITDISYKNRIRGYYRWNGNKEQGI